MNSTETVWTISFHTSLVQWFLTINITENLSWSSHVSSLTTKAQKYLYFWRKLKAKFQCQVLVNFHRGAAASSSLSGNTKIWKALQWVIAPALNITGEYLLSIILWTRRNCCHTTRLLRRFWPQALRLHSTQPMDFNFRFFSIQVWLSSFSDML